jgi:hypothetical protein
METLLTFALANILDDAKLAIAKYKADEDC